MLWEYLLHYSVYYSLLNVPLVEFNFLKKPMSNNASGQEGENLTSNSAIQVQNLVPDSLSSPHKFSSEFSTQVAKFYFSLHNANKHTFLPYLAKKTPRIGPVKLWNICPQTFLRKSKAKPKWLTSWWNNMNRQQL